MQQKNKYIHLAADLQTDSIVDGPGLRAVLWTQGCSHHCKGCQNPQTWDFNGGGLVLIKDVLFEIDKLKYHSGLTLSGGDPLFQVEACYEIIKFAKKKGLDIWVYTGFTYEEIIDMSRTKPIYKDFLKYVDILVDGRFILEERDLSLLFRGSKNQRLIDVQETLKKDQISLFDEVKYSEEKKFEKEPMFI